MPPFSRMSSPGDKPEPVCVAPQQVGLDVVERAAGGDRSAQEAVLEGSYDFVRRMLFRLVGAMDELEDLQQTVMTRIITGLPRFRRESSWSTWVGGICVNVAKDYLRKRRARQGELDSEQSEKVLGSCASSLDLQQAIEAREQLLICHHALDQLSENHRVAFVLRILGHSVDEIAQMTGSARSTTRLRLYYARKKFSRALASEPEMHQAFLAQDVGGA